MSQDKTWISKEMIYSAWKVVLDNHHSALETCKSLVKEGRLLPAKNILTLLETNLNNLSTKGNDGK